MGFVCSIASIHSLKGSHPDGVCVFDCKHLFSEGKLLSVELLELMVFVCSVASLYSLKLFACPCP